jgi:hypothetical protein
MNGQKPNEDGTFGEAETARRRDELARHILRTPPKPHSEMKLGKAKAANAKLEDRAERKDAKS